ncbi:SPOR domain-containing protein [Vibrio metschnikovii]|uniref:SPOR domain-containing protein n=2 Tax=Unclassified Bacteria TaxID=49928 RepID=A0AAU6SX00_UNCXX|nr:SPOR domain-containing protein [Vibrio metschnikovii]EKO3568279.1 SPOR domain-containing protein [Vibrio metschnikovii]EKO3575450.1 SPOR domain-containing protein [Vibrio metschnikovii]EKO3585513.1 SPOR domain-containing protein [Vibrio metschnikovii]EKO3596445.1 SPOR domain-containing protein [Vibrio metschnikovii]
MANKDYVRRGRSPKKPTAKTTTRRKPWRSGLIALILLSGFVYGLYWLNQKPEPPAPPVKTVSPVKPTTPPARVIPPPPTEKWDYVQSLPQREIEVTAKEQQLSEIPYIMQCGAFKTLQQAEARKVEIAFQGLKSNIRKTENSSWFRVVLGPYPLKRDAERDRHRLQRAKIEPCAIWKESQ